MPRLQKLPQCRTTLMSFHGIKPLQKSVVKPCNNNYSWRYSSAGQCYSNTVINKENLQRGFATNGGGYKGFGSFFGDNVEDLVIACANETWEPPTTPFPVEQSVSVQLAKQSGTPVELGKRLLNDFCLDPNWVFVNHGAFGAALRSPLRDSMAWRFHAETQPLRFFDRELFPFIVNSIASLASFIGSNPKDLVLLPNATTGVNTVLQMLEKQRGVAQAKIGAGNEILLLDIEYPSTKGAAIDVAERNGASVNSVQVKLPVESPEQIVEAVASALDDAKKRGNQTVLAVFDHVTSNTAILLPVKRLVELCHAHHVPVLIDGAHGPLSTDLNIEDIGADYYVGNCHKWLGTPKGVAFLHAASLTQVPGLPELVPRDLNPLIVSHGHQHGFLSNFIWDGCRDYSSQLVLPQVISYWNDLDRDRVRDYMTNLAQEANLHLSSVWNVKPNALVPYDMQAAMSMIEIPFRPDTGGACDSSDAKAIQDKLHFEYRIECPVKCINDKLYVRVSAHVYNDIDDYVQLGQAMKQICSA